MADIKSISELVTPIAQKYGADRVALFGSRAKNTATEMSDYDFIISKGKIQSLFQLASFIDELEMAFGRNVDVITDTSNDRGSLNRLKGTRLLFMKQRDNVILVKIMNYCIEVRDTHDYFRHDKELFMNEKYGFIYRNSITMPILQIGELAKALSGEFLDEYKKIPWKMIMRMRDIVDHHYGSLDYEIVWNTSMSDIQGLYFGREEILNG